MIIHNITQGTPEWFALRCGKASASRFKDCLSKGSTRETYLYKLLAEIRTGIPQDSYSNAAMEWGVENEPFARNNYELETGNVVKEVGFVEVNPYLGCSPDGMVGDDGLIEIKCPNSSTHAKYMVKGKMPAEYVAQVQGQLWVTERQWCDFVSFDPRDTGRPFWMLRVERDEKKIEEIKQGVEKFIADLKELERKANK